MKIENKISQLEKVHEDIAELSTDLNLVHYSCGIDPNWMMDVLKIMKSQVIHALQDLKLEKEIGRK